MDVRLSWGIVGALALAGCDHSVKSTATPLTDHPIPASDPSQCPSLSKVEVLHTRDPTQPYDELAMLKVTGNRKSDDKQLLYTLRHQAVDVCADAVMAVTYGNEQRTISTLFCDTCDEDYSATVIRGIAIRYRPPPPPPRSSCAPNEPCAWED